MGMNQFGACLSIMEMLRFADCGTEEPETGRVTVHVTSCESCKKAITEVINWLNARDERRASSSFLSRNIVNLTGRKPLVMYSDERSRRARSAVEPRIVLGEVSRLTYEDEGAIRWWRIYLERKLARTHAIAVADRDPKKE